MSPQFIKKLIGLFYDLGNGDQDLICAYLQQQIMREQNDHWLELFRNREEPDLMKLAGFIKREGKK